MPKRVLHVLELGAHVATQLGVEVGERLVHEEDGGPADDGAGQRHALPLAAREFARIAVQQIAELHLGRGIADRLIQFGLRDFPHLKRKADVLRHGLVRIERVGLEHHGDVAVFRQDVGDVPVADQYAARGCGFKAGEDAQRRRLAGARGAEQHQKFARLDLQVQFLQHAHGAKGFLDLVEGNRNSGLALAICHLSIP